MIKMKIKKKGDFMSISKIRFKGYDNSHERKTIGDITTSFSGGTPKSSNKAYYEGNIPFIRSGEIKSKQTELFISDEALQNSSAKIVAQGDILYALYGATSGEVAISQINGAINQAILAIKPNLGYSSEFIMNYLKKEKDNILEKYLQGGQGNLSAAIVKSIELHLPSHEEQSAIGSLFRTLDDLLASYKDNIANYQSLKATMLSKMFPKTGQSVPEIRLDGFEGEWKVKELGDVVAFYSGLTYKPSDVVSSGTLVLRSSNVSDGELMYKDNVFVNPDIVNCQYVKLGDIVVVVRNGSRDLIGKHALIKSEMPNTVIGAFMTGVKSERPEFVNALLDTKVFISEINKNLGSTINQITTGNFKRMKFSFPTKEEQQVIGAYFSNLDNLINSYQEKISQLETLKKKLLQDMFI
ncbi:restriction endonuclease subunit S [Streptococcus ilei]|uniref:restriction endonuclease subunit S n=1 Tax=Streptococcus ilei TaxID=1156431 RepID=UPI001FD62751|nr:restriction endonuclease subunit S [Streptococcus ilei]